MFSEHPLTVVEVLYLIVEALVLEAAEVVQLAPVVAVAADFEVEKRSTSPLPPFQ